MLLKLAFTLLIVSAILLVIALYQLEVLMILNMQVVDPYFELPFGYPVLWYIARDHHLM